ncbi:A24 family peptidase [Herbiconiux sp. CPCC 205763]|uniref:A24 family peptidase n=1 Tax=Herbiconiux aconitum TaxID=2970913 RepID=A0ABT2GVR9_9MICO|nr:A24 family peptidase [Herbiconiux aconitum]MCS5719029.1 A24 family peptidase [Herbiconiux aconitum]
MEFWPPIFVLVPLAHLAAVTVPLVVIDARTLRLPNALVLPGLAVLGWALVWAAFAEPATTVSGVAGAVGTGVVVLAVWMLGGVGMGDVKLGTWLGGLAGMTGVVEHPPPPTQLASTVEQSGAPVWIASVVEQPGVLLSAAGLVEQLSPLVGGLAAAAALGVAAVLGDPHGRIPFGPPLLAAFWCATLLALPPAP